MADQPERNGDGGTGRPEETVEQISLERKEGPKMTEIEFEWELIYCDADPDSAKWWYS